VVFSLLVEVEALLLGGSVVLILEVLANAPTVDGSGDSPDYIAAGVLELLESEFSVFLRFSAFPFFLSADELDILQICQLRLANASVTRSYSGAQGGTRTPTPLDTRS
jgi:hypothetical protein